MALTQVLWLQWAFPGGPCTHDEAGARESPQGPQRADRPGTGVSCPGSGGLPAPNEGEQGPCQRWNIVTGHGTPGLARPPPHPSHSCGPDARVNPEQGAEQKRGQRSSVTLGPFRKHCSSQRSRWCAPHHRVGVPSSDTQPHWPGALHRGRASLLRPSTLPAFWENGDRK
ncbi:hypothetical protein GH733_000104 [Mirounga leonina]|nr:hypothetical protein GH733_000179 [Mirounga leonina]KAF3831367.1 hypothetical protein GH733_000104 [Mirounga leonina]